MYIYYALKFNLNNLLPDNFELSKEFEDISEQIEHSDDNFYITGKAGSGKSTLLSYFRTITQKKVAVLAPIFLLLLCKKSMKANPKMALGFGTD